MNVMNSTRANSPRIIKIFFEGVHDNSCWEKPRELISRSKIIFNVLGCSLHCFLFDLNNHLLQKLIPLSLWFFLCYHNYWDFAFVIDKGFAEFFRVIINIFAEIEGNDHPHFIRCYLNISMVDVCLIERVEESVVVFERKWTILFITEDIFKKDPFSKDAIHLICF